tara:strand:- start:73 stop:186 length:114 start_codon:yes stop_codon:yes gene_type:complete
MWFLLLFMLLRMVPRWPLKGGRGINYMAREIFRMPAG